MMIPILFQIEKNLKSHLHFEFSSKIKDTDLSWTTVQHQLTQFTVKLNENSQMIKSNE